MARVVVLLLGSLALASLACGTEPKLVAQGGECFQATDCESGLVCLPQKDKSICDSDLGSIQRTEDAAPPRADASADAADGARDGGLADGAGADAVSDAPAQDAPID